jgi:hypothetical protein
MSNVICNVCKCEFNVDQGGFILVRSNYVFHCDSCREKLPVSQFLGSALVAGTRRAETRGFCEVQGEAFQNGPKATPSLGGSDYEK